MLANIRGLTVQFTKGSGWTTKLTDLEHIFGKTVESTTDNGQATICTDLESTYTQMGLDMMANILMTKKMGLGFING